MCRESGQTDLDCDNTECAESLDRLVSIATTQNVPRVWTDSFRLRQHRMCRESGQTDLDCDNTECAESLDRLI